MLARRARLRSHKPLRRKTRLRARRPEPRVRGELADPDYLAWLRLRPCRFPGCPEHTSEAHHLRHDEHGNSLGRNVKDDRRAISLCHTHHIEWLHRMPWVFRFVVRCNLKVWQDRELSQQRAEYLTSIAATDAQNSV